MTRETLFALALGYLFGSIPFGLVLTRLAGKGDVRKIGSHSIGATNVLRKTKPRRNDCTRAMTAPDGVANDNLGGVDCPHPGRSVLFAGPTG